MNTEVNKLVADSLSRIVKGLTDMVQGDLDREGFGPIKVAVGAVAIELNKEVKRLRES